MVPNDDEYEMFNQKYYQTLPDSEEPCMDDDANRLLYTSNTDQTPLVPLFEVNQNFIHVQEDYDTEINIANNIQSEYTKLKTLIDFLWYKMILQKNVLLIYKARISYPIWQQMQEVPPMSQISIDFLASIEVLCYQGSRQVRNVYPLIIWDLNFKAIEVELLEGAAGHDVAFGLLTIQSRYSPITLVVRDAGTALRESVVNIKTGMGPCCSTTLPSIVLTWTDSKLIS